MGTSEYNYRDTESIGTMIFNIIINTNNTNTRSSNTNSSMVKKCVEPVSSESTF